MVAQQFNMLFKKLPYAFVIGLVGGLLDVFLFAPLFTAIAGVAFGQIIATVLLLVVVMWLASKVRFDNVMNSLFNFVIFASVLALVASAIGAFMPAVTQFLLTFNDAITVSGLLYTAMVAMVAEFGLKMFKIRV